MRLADMISAIHSGRPWLAATGVLLYTGLACLCGTAWLRARRTPAQPRATIRWASLALAQLFLAADAFFGIRLFLAEIGREFSRAHGWYAEHRIFQAVTSTLIILAAAILAWRALRSARRLPPGSRLALAGTLLSLLLFLLAAISMHFFEDLLDWPFEPLALGTSLRAAGCLLTAAGGWQYLRRPAVTLGSPPHPPA